ncbi:PREDICTED: eukaryotic translation initiation factor 4E-like isoform X2 [Priapulus caudatus]|uniref:eIF-4F 25 kDa subunit n=1 Tax=Priapulus caudatus TaxID=37621 RepID=A0ABM1EVD6_PRICU|nr:PREDICTED: eukaryotic translation initiation factor 4E-like isoform X2 [Priapulus caudatus]
MSTEQSVTETKAGAAESTETKAVVSTKEVEISPELLIKHPLQNSWTLWFYKNDKQKQWEENQREISTFDTVEDFWALYNHIEAASRLQSGCDYSLFKAGIKPMWEDTKNKSGGRWLINLTRQQCINDLDSYWLETLLCLVGEAFDEQSDDICGTVVQIRTKGDKLAVWTGDLRNNDGILKIGMKYKERLGLPNKVCVMGYQAHADSMVICGSMPAQNRFTV